MVKIANGKKKSKRKKKKNIEVKEIKYDENGNVIKNKGGRPKGSLDKKKRFVEPTIDPKLEPFEADWREKVQEKIKHWRMRQRREVYYQTEFADLLMEHLSQGKSFVTFGAVVLVTKETLYQWVKTYPEFAQAKEIGEMMSQAWWEKHGRRGLRAGNNGFNSTVWSITMRNRFNYKDKTTVEMVGADGAPIKTESLITWGSEAEKKIKELEAKEKEISELKSVDIAKDVL